MLGIISSALGLIGLLGMGTGAFVVWPLLRNNHHMGESWSWDRRFLKLLFLDIKSAVFSESLRLLARRWLHQITHTQTGNHLDFNNSKRHKE